MTIKILIADDHPLFRTGLRAALHGAEGIEVTGEVSDGPTAVTGAAQADVVLMDLHMPGSGIEATRQIASAYPQVAVLILTMIDNDDSLFAAMRAGARGYLVKGAERDEIIHAIRAVRSGQVIFGAGVAAKALAFFTAAPTGGRSARPFPALTDRELEILQLIARGRNNGDIARQLFLADKTVRNHVSSIFAKLQVADRSEAIVRAREAGLALSRPPRRAPGCPRRQPPRAVTTLHPCHRVLGADGLGRFLLGPKMEIRAVDHEPELASIEVAADLLGNSPDRQPPLGGSSISAMRKRTAHRFRKVAFPQIRGGLWSGTGSNCRPSAFQVNRAKRCADLRKRWSLTSGTALGGRCKIHASRTRYTPSTRQGSYPTQDHRDRRWRDHGATQSCAAVAHEICSRTSGYPPHSRKQATLWEASPD
jgi:DNA-binding NarL/FixJ family response regulator